MLRSLQRLKNCGTVRRLSFRLTQHPGVSVFWETHSWVYNSRVAIRFLRGYSSDLAVINARVYTVKELA